MLIYAKWFACATLWFTEKLISIFIFFYCFHQRMMTKVRLYALEIKISLIFKVRVLIGFISKPSAYKGIKLHCPKGGENGGFGRVAQPQSLFLNWNMGRIMDFSVAWTLQSGGSSPCRRTDVWIHVRTGLKRCVLSTLCEMFVAKESAERNFVNRYQSAQPRPVFGTEAALSSCWAVGGLSSHPCVWRLGTQWPCM